MTRTHEEGPPFGWRADLARLDATWADMLASGDMARIRRRLTLAGTFALFSIRQQVSTHEACFRAWLADPAFRPASLPRMREAGMGSLTAWVDRVTLDDVSGDGWSLARLFDRHVTGLGPAKASFAAALCGTPEPYCLDVHGLRHAVSLGYRATITRPRTWRDYRASGDPTFGNRDGQWAFFAERVPAFASDGHGAYFAAALKGDS